MSDTKSQILQGLNLMNGDVTYNEFDIDPNLPFQQQELSFTGDLLQIVFDEKYLIDVGWYPDFDEKGHFLVHIIKDFDLCIPLLKESCRDYYDLKKLLQKAIDFVSFLD